LTSSEPVRHPSTSVILWPERPLRYGENRLRVFKSDRECFEPLQGETLILAYPG
jgi:hypothetical protein